MACPLGCRDEKGEVSRVERREVEIHKTCCPMRSVKCEYCSVSVKACDMNGHLEVCKEFSIPCPNKCSEEFRVKRKNKSIHLSQECPLQETECPYSQYGCEVKVKRRNLEQHEKEDIHKHMKFTIDNMQSEVITLQKCNNEYQNKVVKLEEKNEKLRTKIVHLENKNEEFRSSLREEKEDIHKHLKFTMNKVVNLEKENEMMRNLVSTGSLKWTISGVRSKISQKRGTYSDPFYVGLYKFQGCVQWNEEGNHVGLYLHIMKGEWDDALKWPIRYKSPQLIINQLDANDNYVRNDEITEEDLENFTESLIKPSTEMNRGLGRYNFISHADLLREKYSKDDKVTLKISVELF